MKRRDAELAKCEWNGRLEMIQKPPRPKQDHIPFLLYLQAATFALRHHHQEYWSMSDCLPPVATTRPLKVLDLSLSLCPFTATLAIFISRLRPSVLLVEASCLALLVLRNVKSRSLRRAANSQFYESYCGGKMKAALLADLFALCIVIAFFARASPPVGSLAWAGS